MTGSAQFFAALKGGLLGPTLSQGEVDGCNAILDACAGLPRAWTAYALATAYHETAHTLQPVPEHGGPDYFRRMYDPAGARPEVAARLGNTQAGDGARFCGRGYVQLTGRANYQRAARELGDAAILQAPDRALDPNVAAVILRRGMVEGWFTGRGFDRYLPSDGAADRGQFTSARAIINGHDRDDLIAGYALAFQAALGEAPAVEVAPIAPPDLAPTPQTPAAGGLATLFAQVLAWLGIGR